jgi:hypothetical protein
MTSVGNDAMTANLLPAVAAGLLAGRLRVR